jgi:hypothetical protein
MNPRAQTPEQHGSRVGTALAARFDEAPANAMLRIIETLNHGASNVVLLARKPRLRVIDGENR